MSPPKKAKGTRHASRYTVGELLEPDDGGGAAGPPLGFTGLTDVWAPTRAEAVLVVTSSVDVDDSTAVVGVGEVGALVGLCEETGGTQST